MIKHEVGGGEAFWSCTIWQAGRGVWLRTCVHTYMDLKGIGLPARDRGKAKGEKRAYTYGNAGGLEFGVCIL